MMTPLVIAHKALKGDLSNAFGGLCKGDLYLFRALDNSHYITDDDIGCNGIYEYISTVEEFNNFKGDEMKAPVFTQEMADKDVLPSVGMECLYKERGGINWCKCKVIAIHGVKIWIENLDKQSTPLNNISTLEFKPLTPPIELISGKAYQFDYGNTTEIIGLYSKRSKQLQAIAGHYESKHCANIKPLIVEGK